MSCNAMQRQQAGGVGGGGDGGAVGGGDGEDEPLWSPKCELISTMSEGSRSHLSNMSRSAI